MFHKCDHGDYESNRMYIIRRHVKNKHEYHPTNNEIKQIRLNIYLLFHKTVHISFNTIWAHCNVCNAHVSRESRIFLWAFCNPSMPMVRVRGAWGHPEQPRAGGCVRTGRARARTIVQNNVIFFHMIYFNKHIMDTIFSHTFIISNI